MERTREEWQGSERGFGGAVYVAMDWPGEDTWQALQSACQGSPQDDGMLSKGNQSTRG